LLLRLAYACLIAAAVDAVIHPLPTVLMLLPESPPGPLAFACSSSSSSSVCCCEVLVLLLLLLVLFVAVGCQ
jgi:hypothetical protein